jgi:hypothetical protein
LKSELSPLFGKTNLIWDDLKNRTYLEAFIKETLRVYGPSIGISAREAISTHKLGNITVLKGIFEIINKSTKEHTLVLEWLLIVIIQGILLTLWCLTQIDG